MGKWLKIVLILLSFSLVSFGLVYQYGGLKIYFQATQNKNLLDSGDPNVYGGILAGISYFNIPRIWIWGNNGLHSFKVDENTVYSIFHICDDSEILKLANIDGAKFSVDRSIYTDLDQWKIRTKQGDFIVVMTANIANRGNLGYAREVKSHDWWAFMPVDTKDLCKR